jgi:hypothetical protein
MKLRRRTATAVSAVLIAVLLIDPAGTGSTLVGTGSTLTGTGGTAGTGHRVTVVAVHPGSGPACASGPGTPKRQFREMWARWRHHNAVTVQVPPAADTSWPSAYEPWSEYRTACPAGFRAGTRWPSASKRHTRWTSNGSTLG